MTRQNRIPCINDDKSNEMCLIPSWDMCNCKSGKLNSYFDNNNQIHHMKLMENININEQIYMNYGRMRTEELLVNSGFVYFNNPNDKIELQIRLPQKDQFLPLKKIMLKKYNIKDFFNCLFDIPLPKSLDQNNTKLIIFFFLVFFFSIFFLNNFYWY